MKRMMTLLLALALLLSMTACGSTVADSTAAAAGNTAASAAGTEHATEAAGNTQSAAEAAAEAAEADAAMVNEAESSAAAPAEAPAEEADASGDTLTMYALKASVQETVLADEQGVQITATGIDYSDHDPMLQLTIENTTGQDIMVRSGNDFEAIVNGYMTAATLDATVAAGETVETALMLYTDELMLLGITEITEITVSFEVTGAEAGDLLLTTDPVTISTDAASAENDGASFADGVQNSAVQEALGYSVTYYGEGATDITDGLQLLSEAVLTYADGSTALVMEVENTGATVHYVTASNLVINGLQLDIGYWDIRNIAEGTRAVMTVSFDPVRFAYICDTYQISEIGSIGATLSGEDVSGNELEGTLSFAVTLDEAAAYTSVGDAAYDAGGVTISVEGVTEDNSYGETTMHILMTVTNQTGAPIHVYDVPDTCLLNGTTAAELTYSATLEDGVTGVLNVEIDAFTLEDLGITGVDDVHSAEITLDIEDSEFSTLDQPTITVNFD